MIEADIEKRVVEKFKELFTENGIDNVQVSGSFDISDIKATQESGKTSYLVVKVDPRSYGSPTLPETTLDIGFNLIVRADVDFNGKTYLDLCDILMTQMEIWQKCMNEAHDFFTLPEFEMTGFVLNKGTTGIDPTATTFQYNHTFTVYGVVQNFDGYTPNHYENN